MILYALIVLFGAGIAVILKNGFNENVKGLESINQKLKNIEEKLEERK